MMPATEVKAAAPVDASSAHDHGWWASEAARTGSDWEGLLAFHLEILASCGCLQACDMCDRAPCRSPQFCRACRQADERKARGEQPDYMRDWENLLFDALWRRFNQCRPTAQSTVEAIMIAVRERGVAALKEPQNLERLERCDAAARAQVNHRIAKLSAPNEVAR